MKLVDLDLLIRALETSILLSEDLNLNQKRIQYVKDLKRLRKATFDR